MTKIRRLLIANRGEITCRIVATCRAMGIETVTVFAEDDRDCRMPARAILPYCWKAKTFPKPILTSKS